MIHQLLWAKFMQAQENAGCMKIDLFLSVLSDRPILATLFMDMEHA